MSRPVEYLTFQNGGTRWRYTNSNINEQLGPRVFTPLAYTRTEPAFAKNSNDGQVKFVIPSSLPLVDLYDTLPSSFTTTVQIETADRDTPGSERVFWQGQVVSVQKAGQFTTILAAPATAVPSQVPRYVYSGLCNWVLFQDGCSLNRQDWRHESTVDSVESQTVFTVDGLSTQAAALATAAGGNLTQGEIDAYWQGGYVETSLGEKRPIYEANVDGVPSRIRILRPFKNLLQAADGVTVYAGCARTRDICNRKFQNALRHGGFPDIPEGINPFRTELPPGSLQDTSKKSWFGN